MPSNWEIKSIFFHNRPPLSNSMPFDGPVVLGLNNRQMSI
jgi:hypothetical protein